VCNGAAGVKTRVMPIVKFTYALKRFFPALKDTPAKSMVLAEILDEIEASYPGINSYILDDQGRIIFIEEAIRFIIVPGTMTEFNGDLP
jgi:hypothetical protein